ncbi:MAG TPA: hypothetical protein VHZ76_03010 [Gammaproteobacteria bacterium]|nr:hypothetical protein [Gammaproteobacteria bacterium]
MTGQFPALIKLTKGNSDKPLVIFVPGDSHLARIAYNFGKISKTHGKIRPNKFYLISSKTTF